jgi:hypothetical protein
MTPDDSQPLMQALQGILAHQEAVIAAHAALMPDMEDALTEMRHMQTEMHRVHQEMRQMRYDVVAVIARLDRLIADAKPKDGS